MLLNNDVKVVIRKVIKLDNQDSYFSEKEKNYIFANVYVLNENMKCINDELLRNGLAWYCEKYSKSSKLFSIQKLAQKNKKGLWSIPSSSPPWEFRKYLSMRRAKEEKARSEERSVLRAELEAQKRKETDEFIKQLIVAQIEQKQRYQRERITIYERESAESSFGNYPYNNPRSNIRSY